MSELAAAAAAALPACDREPIHVPGAVQPHGLLLALDPHRRTVLQASATTTRFLGRDPEQVLGSSVERVLGASELTSLHEALSRSVPQEGDPFVLTVLTPAGPEPFEARLHRVDDVAVLELEPVRGIAAAPAGVAGLARVREAIVALDGAATMSDLCEEAVRQVRAITGFDRVMAYHFHPDGHGEVLAEARAAGQDPYLGLHYPASDIPRQARELYLRQWLRLIADVDYRPAPLAPERNPRTGRPLDLGLAALRSVSPIHLQYLRNMQVSASMSVSLVVDGELWGLIACHHRSPRRVGYAVRALCELLGRLVSAQLVARRQHAAVAAQLEVKRRHSELVECMAELDTPARGLIEGRTTALDLVAADGLVARIDGAPATVGAAPSAAAADRLVDRVRRDRGPGVYATDALGERYPEFADVVSVASGAIVVPLQARGEYVAWFRREAVATVDWAGDPRKATGPDGLSPRASFARWSETVRGRSRPWTRTELDAAADLRRSISDLQLRRAQAELARLGVHDALTGLPNRRLLMDRLEHALTRAERSGVSPTLLFIDLDHFKDVNDRGGHAAGDAALVETAARLTRLTRAADTVARLGGDEFVVLCEDAEPDEVDVLAERLVEAFIAPFAIDGREWTITASIGVAAADVGNRPQDVLARADRAMYHSKRAGGNRSSPDDQP